MRNKRGGKVALRPGDKNDGKSERTTTKWYQDVDDYYDDDEIEKFNVETSQQQQTKNSRNSLETDEEVSYSDESEIEFAADDFHDGGSGGGAKLMSKLFHSTPSLGRKKQAIRRTRKDSSEENEFSFRPRAPTSEKLEKYKFMLVNIEPDEEILDPASFALMQDSYVGFEFNDYPAEVFCPVENLQQNYHQQPGKKIVSRLQKVHKSGRKCHKSTFYGGYIFKTWYFGGLNPNFE